VHHTYEKAKRIKLILCSASAVLSIGAATLADIYEPHERGTMMGIYYAAPLLGPSMGPLVGGVATQLFNWRATFWVLVIFGGISLATFTVFKDTFRRERSLTYQTVSRRLYRQRVKREDSLNGQELRQAVEEKGGKQVFTKSDMEKNDLESQRAIPAHHHVPEKDVQVVKLSLKDVNPFPPFIMILRRWNNIVILIASGFLFAISYCIGYTCSRTFSMKYHYDALQIGLVLLSFGLGCMAGSILGGRWSDNVLRKLKAKNGGRSYPEMRLESTKPAMLFTPITCIAYAWLCQEKVHVAAVCVALFFAGFFIMLASINYHGYSSLTDHSATSAGCIQALWRISSTRTQVALQLPLRQIVASVGRLDLSRQKSLRRYKMLLAMAGFIRSGLDLWSSQNSLSC